MDATTCSIMLVHPVLCVRDTMKINLKELKITTFGLGQNSPHLTMQNYLNFVYALSNTLFYIIYVQIMS